MSALCLCVQREVLGLSVEATATAEDAVVYRLVAVLSVVQVGGSVLLTCEVLDVLVLSEIEIESTGGPPSSQLLSFGRAFTS